MSETKYIILDRDGVINVDLFDYVTNPSDFKFETGSLEALKMLTTHNFKIVVATNQACISLGIATQEEIENVNLHMKQKVKEFCDKNFKENASNYANYSEVNMIPGSEYYKTYADEFGKSGHYDDNTFYTDYGQKYDTREFFKHDFNKQVTKFMGGII